MTGLWKDYIRSAGNDYVDKQLTQADSARDLVTQNPSYGWNPLNWIAAKSYRQDPRNQQYVKDKLQSRLMNRDFRNRFFGQEMSTAQALRHLIGAQGGLGLGLMGLGAATKNPGIALLGGGLGLHRAFTQYQKLKDPQQLMQKAFSGDQGSQQAKNLLQAGTTLKSLFSKQASFGSYGVLFHDQKPSVDNAKKLLSAYFPISQTKRDIAQDPYATPVQKDLMNVVMDQQSGGADRGFMQVGQYLPALVGAGFGALGAAKLAPALGLDKKQKAVFGIGLGAIGAALNSAPIGERKSW